MSSPVRGKSSVETGYVRRKIAAREKVETRVFVARRETGVGFNEPDDNQKLKIYNLIIMDKSGSMSSISDAAISGFNETVGGIRSAQERYKDTQEHFVSLFTFCDCEKNVLIIIFRTSS